jgi:hypothetical protein
MLDAAAIVHRCMYERQSVLEFLAERSGSIGRGQPGAMPPEQRDSDLGLEGPHSLAYGGWCDAQFSSGMREVAVPDTGGEDTQGFQGRQVFSHASI